MHASNYRGVPSRITGRENTTVKGVLPLRRTLSPLVLVGRIDSTSKERVFPVLSENAFASTKITDITRELLIARCTLPGLLAIFLTLCLLALGVKPTPGVYPTPAKQQVPVHQSEDRKAFIPPITEQEKFNPPMRAEKTIQLTNQSPVGWQLLSRIGRVFDDVADFF